MRGRPPDTTGESTAIPYSALLLRICWCERNKKFLILGIDVTEDMEIIKKSMAAVPGVLDVWRLRRTDAAGKKTEISPILVTVTSATKINEIRELYAINHVRFRVVPYEEKRGIPQCHRCQQFGHTKNHCGQIVVCVRCSGNHPSSACTQEKEVKCSNCGQNHVASFRECPAEAPGCG